MRDIGIIGAGAWGTALAILANRAGCRVKLWTRNFDVIESIQRHNRNEIYLPDSFVDPAIQVIDSLEEACHSDLVILAIPAQHMRSVAITIPDYLDKSIPLMIACKGIERGSGKLISEILTRFVPENPIAVISGPNFAHEVVAGKPSATTIACGDGDIAQKIAYAIGTSFFRPYISKDIIGAQVGGAVKNVIAIACGIILGLDLGENARAALLTRGLAEMSRLTIAKGGRLETIIGLSGMGDLVLTCSGTRENISSRNMRYGYYLSQGMSHEEATIKIKGICEGYDSSESLSEIAVRMKIEMPISEAVYDISHNKADINEAIERLMQRPIREEL